MKYAKLMLVGFFAIIGLGCYGFTTNASDDFTNNIYYDNVDYTDNVLLNSVEGVNIDYSAQLMIPGDYYELYFDVVNKTNYDVKINECIYNEDDDYIDYELTYDDGEVINIGDIIKNGESVRIKYKVLYKNYIDKENYILDTSFSILYGQVR
jgi:hypothetical protein